MISLIICFRDEQLLERVKENIAQTIGIAYEVIAIDNRQNKYGICAAYNLGAAQARYPYLCFMHEDIAYQTQNWGEKISAILEDSSIGLVGVAGSRHKTKMPGPWCVMRQGFNQVNIIQGFPDERPGSTVYMNPRNERLSDAVTVDGVWFCCRKSVWQECLFDEKNFPEFHFYDLDFSLQIFYKGYRVCVTFDILIEHFSPGSLNESWIKNAIHFSKKWKNQLPVGVDKLHPNVIRKLELGNCKYFLGIMMHNNVKNLHFVRYVAQYFFSRPSGRSTIEVLKRIFRTRTGSLYGIVKRVFKPSPLQSKENA